MVKSSGRFKTAHTGCYLSAKAYGEVHRFETALYGALLRGQSKKRHLHARVTTSFKEVKCYHYSVHRTFPTLGISAYQAWGNLPKKYPPIDN